MKNLIIKSFAKINICLDLKGKREDGYHDLDMVMLPISLHDSILLTEQKADTIITIDDFSLGQIKYNLAMASYEAMCKHFKFNNQFRILIHKGIPIKAGLGGGSSNAAYTMMGLNKYLKLNASDEELAKLAKPLGADIPFFFTHKPARCTGIGEKVKPIIVKNNYYVILVKPEKGCKTKEVYEKADDISVRTGNVEDVIKALETGDDELLASSMFNALEDAAISFVPEIKEIKNRLHRCGLKIVQTTGSGSCVFGMSTDKKLIKKIAKELLEEYYFVDVCKVLKETER